MLMTHVTATKGQSKQLAEPRIDFLNKLCNVYIQHENVSPCTIQGRLSPIRGPGHNGIMGPYDHSNKALCILLEEYFLIQYYSF